MPPKRNSPPRPARRGVANSLRHGGPSAPPPPVMTVPKAMPVLALVLVFYALRFIFEQFWFFGPAIAAAYCTAKVSDTVGTAIGATLCSAGAGAVGYFGSGPIAAFGTVMAMAVGFLGSLTIWLIIALTNHRILKERSGVVKFVASGAVSEIPIIGSLPVFEVTILLMYLFQIAKEKMALKKWKAEQKQLQLQERNQKIIKFQQERATQLEQAEQQEVENNEISEQKQIEQQESENKETNKEEEIPEDVRMAA